MQSIRWLLRTHKGRPVKYYQTANFKREVSVANSSLVLPLDVYYNWSEVRETILWTASMDEVFMTNWSPNKVSDVLRADFKSSLGILWYWKDFISENSWTVNSTLLQSKSLLQIPSNLLKYIINQLYKHETWGMRMVYFNNRPVSPLNKTLIIVLLL